MATAGEILTGSTDAPIQDGGVRGFIQGVIIFAIGIAESRLDWLTDTELATLLGLVATGLLVGAGMWDAWARGRVLSRAKSPVTE